MSVGPIVDQDMEVREVKDGSQIRQIVEQLFLKLPVNLVEGDSQHPVRLKPFRDGHFIIVSNRPESETRTLVLQRGEQVMLLECSVKHRVEKSEVVKPMRLHLHRPIRQAKRLEVIDGTLHVRNVVAIRDFPERFAKFDEKENAILQAYEKKFKESYPLATLVIRRSSRADVRMRAMLKTGESIFAPDVASQVGWTFGHVSFNDYKQLLQYEPLRQDIVSEITTPLSYRGLYMIGYLQVISEKPLGEDDKSKLEGFCTNLVKELENRQFFPKNPEKCQVVDVSTSGIGIDHPHNPGAMRSFMPGEEIIFDLMNNGEVVPFQASIRNLRAQENSHRVGIQFKDLSPIQTDTLTGVLASLGK